MAPSMGCVSRKWSVYSVCGAPFQPSMRSSKRAADTTTGCRKVRAPRRRWGSGAFERNSSAGELMAPPATTTCRAVMRVRRADAAAPLSCTGTASRPRTVRPSMSRRSTRACTSSVAPRSSAVGIVVTSIDCLALVGQPMPHEPRFQQPRTLRWMAAAGMPSRAAPTRSSWLLAFGGTSHGPMCRRCSTCWNHGASASSVRSGNAKCARQCASVAPGVRNELVQLTVVEPPTQRPCRMPMALSAVLRLALSW